MKPHRRGLHEILEEYQGDQLERELALGLGRALIMIPVLSLLLWWGILSVVAPLAAALLK